MSDINTVDLMNNLLVGVSYPREEWSAIDAGSKACPLFVNGVIADDIHFSKCITQVGSKRRVV